MKREEFLAADSRRGGQEEIVHGQTVYWNDLYQAQGPKLLAAHSFIDSRVWHTCKECVRGKLGPPPRGDSSTVAPTTGKNFSDELPGGQPAERKEKARLGGVPTRADPQRRAALPRAGNVQPVFDDPAAEQMPVDTQQPGSRTLVVAGVFQREADVLALDLGGSQPVPILRRLRRNGRGLPVSSLPEKRLAGVVSDCGETTCGSSFAGALGSTSGPINSPGEKRIARSRAFSSSRTLPGQG